MIQIIKMAIRDLGRNRRRSFFSSLAVGMGLSLLLLIASFINGEMNGAMDRSIRLQTGHIQVRAQTYDESKQSLKWEDLVVNPDQVASKIASLPQVLLATPRLYAAGIISVGESTVGVKIVGIDPLSGANAPYRDGVVSGAFLTSDDRTGILVGKPLAEKLGLNVGDAISLSANTSNGTVNEQTFTIRGLYSTETNAFDTTTVFLPLAKAQALSQAEDHASVIFVMLKDKANTQAVATALKSSSDKILTWTEMNDLIIQTENLSRGYMLLIYLIVLFITATVIVNTLLMAVFERTREIGILSAIGMKSSRIMAMFLAESSLMAVGGILIGLVLGSLMVGYFTKYGFYIGKMGITGITVGNTVYAQMTMQDTITLTIIAFVITLLAGLYPAVMAARMEPVTALHGGD